MGLFSKKPKVCPICGVELSKDPNEVVGHVLSNHLDDDVRGDPNSGLRLACGCREAVWPVGSPFPRLAVEHLERVHGMAR